MKRSGFTMIELIFVIVILGILAAVAIQKLAATRNDATAATVASSLATCINEQGGKYTKDGNFTGATSALIAASSGSCTAAITTNPCYTLTSTDSNGTLSVTGSVAGSTTATDTCGKAIFITNKNGLSNGTTAVGHAF